MRKKKILMTAEETQSVWTGWHGGESMSDIARDIDKLPATVFGLLRKYGGIEPSPRTRRPRTLSIAEREENSRGLGGRRRHPRYRS